MQSEEELDDGSLSATQKPCTLQQTTTLMESIQTMLIKDMRPMSMVDGEGFHEMIRQFNPEYTSTTKADPRYQYEMEQHISRDKDS